MYIHIYIYTYEPLNTSGCDCLSIKWMIEYGNLLGDSLCSGISFFLCRFLAMDINFSPKSCDDDKRWHL